MNEIPASKQIDDIISLYGGWKGDTIAHLRTIIISTDTSLVEEVKWKMKTRPEGLPVWSSDGIVCMIETFKNDLKLVFTKGALMNDMQDVFNARLNSSTDRAIEFHDGDSIPEDTIKELVAAGVRINQEKKASR